MNQVRWRMLSMIRERRLSTFIDVLCVYFATVVMTGLYILDRDEDVQGGDIMFKV